jgi:hypothetical protein
MWRELLTRPWWTYDPETTGPWGLAYRWFNFAEGGVWLAFTLLVLRRWRRERNSWIELWYATAFLTFGLSDLREAYVLSLPLVVGKGINLVVLLPLRQSVTRRWYPQSRVY